MIVDFRMGRLPVGPDDSHKLAPDVVEREMKLGGYALCKSWNGLPLPVRSHVCASLR